MNVSIQPVKVERSLTLKGTGSANGGTAGVKGRTRGPGRDRPRFALVADDTDDSLKEIIAAMRTLPDPPDPRTTAETFGQLIIQSLSRIDAQLERLEKRTGATTGELAALHARLDSERERLREALGELRELNGQHEELRRSVALSAKDVEGIADQRAKAAAEELGENMTRRQTRATFWAAFLGAAATLGGVVLASYLVP